MGFRLADVRNQVCSVRRAQKEMRMFKVIHILGCFCEMGHYELFSRGTPPSPTKTCKMHVIQILDCIRLFETGE